MEVTDADLGDLTDYFVAFGFSFAFELAFGLVLFAVEVLDILLCVGLNVGFCDTHSRASR